MESMKRLAETLLVAGLCLGLAGEVQCQEGGKLVGNGDFEKGLEGWRATNKDRVSVLADDKGNHYAAIDSTRSGCDIAIRLPRGSLKQGAKYVLSFKAKIDQAGSSACVQIANLNWEGNKGIFLETNPTWKTYSMELTPPPDTNNGNFELAIRTKGSKIQIDDINFLPAEAKAEKAPTTAAQPEEAGTEVQAPAAGQGKKVQITTSAGQNLVINGNFENVSAGRPAEWSLFDSSEENILLEQDGDNHYVLLDNRADGKNTVLMQTLRESLLPQTECLLSFRAKVGHHEGGVVCVMVTNANWGPSQAKYLSLAPEWKEYTLQFRPESVYDRVLIRVANGKASVSVDDIYLTDSLPRKTTQTNPFLKLRKAKDSIEVENPHFKATVSSFGGKISQIQVDDYEWAVSAAAKWATGIGKEWIAEDKDKEALTANYDLSVIEQTKDEAVIKASYLCGGGLAGLVLEREFSFFADRAELSVKTTISNQGENEMIITPRIHNYLNIWRTIEETPSFKIFISGGETPYQLLLIPALGETIKKGDKESRWAGVVNVQNKNGLLFLLDEEGPAEWMVWSGFETSKGTLEMCYKSIPLGSKEEWQVSYHIFPTRSLPSFGHASREVLASVGEPDIDLYFPGRFAEASIKVETETGGLYQYFRETINPSETVKVSISSILDPGKANLVIQSPAGEVVAKGIPRSTTILPSRGAIVSSDKPYRYLPLTVKPVPDPGNGSFLYYASDYYQHEIYASPDIPTMIAFGQKSRLPEDKASPEIHLLLDLPAGFKIHGGRFIAEPVEVSPLQIEGKPYARFRVHSAYGKKTSRSGATELIVSTALKAPSTYRAYYATEIDGQSCHRREISLHIIRIPRVGSPKIIRTRFWPLHGVLDAYPDITAFNQIGFAYPDADYFNRVIKSGALRKSEFIGRGYGRFLASEDDAKNVDIHGKKVGGLCCPTYRGGDVLALIAQGKAAIDLGVYEHGFDPERGDGKDICFCPRCLSGFQDYLKKNSRLEYKDPREFMKAPGKYAEHHKLWARFKVEKENEKYRMYREEMLKYMGGKEIDRNKLVLFLAAQPGWRDQSGWPNTIEKSLQDPLILKDIFDYYCPMIYIEINGRFRMAADMLEVAEEVRGIIEYSKGKVAVTPTLSVGYPYSQLVGNFEPNGMMKYQILEAFAAGAKGFVVYSEGWFDALDMKCVAEAMQQVIPVESIIAKGKPIEEGRIRDLNDTTFVKGIQCEEGAVILVSDYSTQPKEARIEYKVGRPSEVVDLSTGESIARVSPSNAIFEVKLGKDRAKLIQVKYSN